MRRAAFPLIAALALTVSCTKDPDKRPGKDKLNDTASTTTDVVIATPKELAVTYEESEVIPTVLIVSWTADPGRGQIEYGLTANLGETTPLTAEGESHERVVLGLKAASLYYWRVVHELPDGTRLASPTLTFQTGEPPDGYKKYTLHTVDPAQSEVHGGFLLISQAGAGNSFASIIDSDGDLVWWATDTGGEEQIMRARMALDGKSIVYSAYDGDRSSDLGRIYRMSLDGRTSTETRALSHHHDFVQRDANTFAWLSWDYEPHVIDNLPMDVAADVVRMAPEGYMEEEEHSRLFSFFSDFPIAPFWSCSHMGYDQYVNDHYEWTHSNSVNYEPVEDAFYVLARYIDTLVKIDASTGSYIWQMGGDNNDFTSPEGDGLINHSHMSHVWPGGALIFDNNNHAGQNTSVIEYEWDEATMTVEKVWEYAEPSGRFTSFLGDARRLPNGNTLITFSPHGDIHEVTPAGDIVWEASTNQTPWRVSYVPDLYDPFGS